MVKMRPLFMCHLIVFSEYPIISTTLLTVIASGYIARRFSSIRSNLFLSFLLRYEYTLIPSPEALFASGDSGITKKGTRKECPFVKFALQLFVDAAGELLLLDFGVDVVHRLDLLAFLYSSEVVCCDLYNEGRKNKNTDKVGDHHEAVEGIGDVPSERGCENRTEDNCAYMDDAEDVGCLCAEEIFPCL